MAKTQGTESLVTILVWGVNPLAKSLSLFIALTKDILLSNPYFGLFFLVNKDGKQRSGSLLESHLYFLHHISSWYAASSQPRFS